MEEQWSSSDPNSLSAQLLLQAENDCVGTHHDDDCLLVDDEEDYEVNADNGNDDDEIGDMFPDTSRSAQPYVCTMYLC